MSSTAAKPAQRSTDRRAKLIRLIHVAKRELGLDDDTYRTLLRSASGGLDSTASMNEPQLQAVLNQAKRSGFAVRSSSPGKPARRLDTSPEAKKVRALWLFLHHLKAVRDPSEQALAAYCKRIAKVDDLHWAASGQMVTLIETLKKWALRGYLPSAVVQQFRDLAEHTPPLPGAQAAAVKARLCLERGTGFDVHWSAWCTLNQALGRPAWPDLPAPKEATNP